MLGPEHIPRITDPEVARQTPELAVLSSLVHGNGADGAHIAAAAGRVDALLALMAARGLAPDEAELLRIRACNDLDMLETWVTRAVRAGTVAEVLQ